MRIPKHIVHSVVKGFTGRARQSFKIGVVVAMGALRRSFIDRRHRYRRYRAFWNVRTNAASREWDFPLSKFYNGLKRANIKIDRKNLAALAMTEPISFKCLVDEAKRVYYSQHRSPRRRNLFGF